MPTETEPEPETKTPCITEGCDKDARWKGLCPQCYGIASELIRNEQTTWGELKELGLADIPDKPFLAAFKKRKKAVA